MQARRGIHAAIFSTIGAIGFLASAVLPADAYHVSWYTPRAGRDCWHASSRVMVA